MSAWYVLSAFGFYPCNMGSGEYVITSPLYDKYTLHLPTGDLTVKAENNSDKNVYIQSMTIDGAAYNKSYITHEKLLKAKNIVFTMGDTPSSWATDYDSTPSSITKVNEVPKIAEDFAPLAQKSCTGLNSGNLMFDNNSETSSNFTNTAKVDFNFNEPKKVEMLTVASGNIKNSKLEIRLTASKTGAAGSYVELINEKNAEYEWRGFIKPYVVDNPDEYSYYTLEFTKSGNGSVGEIELLGDFHKYFEMEKGDIDGDGAVTVADALVVLRASLRLTALPPDFEIGDMDGDGVLTVSDSLRILIKACK